MTGKGLELYGIKMTVNRKSWAQSTHVFFLKPCKREGMERDFSVLQRRNPLWESMKTLYSSISTTCPTRFSLLLRNNLEIPQLREMEPKERSKMNVARISPLDEQPTRIGTKRSRWWKKDRFWSSSLQPRVTFNGLLPLPAILDTRPLYFFFSHYQRQIYPQRFISFLARTSFPQQQPLEILEKMKRHLTLYRNTLSWIPIRSKY